VIRHSRCSSAVGVNNIMNQIMKLISIFSYCKMSSVSKFYDIKLFSRKVCVKCLS